MAHVRRHTAFGLLQKGGISLPIFKKRSSRKPAVLAGVVSFISWISQGLGGRSLLWAPRTLGDQFCGAWGKGSRLRLAIFVARRSKPPLVGVVSHEPQQEDP